jgi:propionyl-CoA synthetase
MGGEMNTCYNMLDVHVNAGRGDVVAFHYDSPLTGTKTTITYSQLLKEGRSWGSACSSSRRKRG